MTTSVAAVASPQATTMGTCRLLRSFQTTVEPAQVEQQLKSIYRQQKTRSRGILPPTLLHAENQHVARETIGSKPPGSVVSRGSHYSLNRRRTPCKFQESQHAIILAPARFMSSEARETGSFFATFFLIAQLPPLTRRQLGPPPTAENQAFSA